MIQTNRRLNLLCHSDRHIFNRVTLSKTVPQVWSLPHAYTDKTQAHCSLSAQPSLPTSSSAPIPIYVPITPPPPSSRAPTPKIEFQGPYWNPFPIKPSPSSDISPSSIHSIVFLPRRFYVILGLPLSPSLRPHPTSTSSPPSDKTGLPERHQGRQKVNLFCCYYELFEHAK